MYCIVLHCCLVFLFFHLSQLTIYSVPADLACSTVEPKLATACVGKSASFDIVLLDKLGAASWICPVVRHSAYERNLSLQVYIYGGDDFNTKMTANEQGTFMVSFVPSSVGRYKISIVVADVPFADWVLTVV